MKKQFTIAICLTFALIAGADNVYRYSVNLTSVDKDRLRVTLYPPDIRDKEIKFMFPSIVPGTYEIYDFGRFISNFTAKGKGGSKLKVTREDLNTFQIIPADAIESITYEVDDTFDKSDQSPTKNKIVFEPAGSGFDANKNFSFNTFCLFGYFKGMS